MGNSLKKIAVVVLVLAVIVIVVPLVIPIPPMPDTVPVTELSDPDSQFLKVDVRGTPVTVHVKEFNAESDGPTVVLLHRLASSTYSWREVTEPLSEVARVVALDWLPFGLTDRPLPDTYSISESPYSQDAQVDLVLGVMDTLGVKQAILVGNAEGGRIAAQIAIQHPERVMALVLVDAPIDLPDASDEAENPDLFSLLGTPVGRAIGRTPQMRRIGPVLIRNIPIWGPDYARRVWHDPGRITEEIWAGYQRPMRAENWDVGLYEYGIAPPSTVDVSANLDALDLPALVLTGDDDRIVPTQNSIQLANRLPNAELTTFDTCGHAPQEECPRPFLEVVESFISQF